MLLSSGTPDDASRELNTAEVPLKASLAARASAHALQCNPTESATPKPVPIMRTSLPLVGPEDGWNAVGEPLT